MAKQALILYYSQFGNTARLASKIHEATGADIVRIKVPDDTFPLDMEETGKIYQQQLKTHDFPKLVTTLPDLSYYDLILVGGPVWNEEVASPIIAGYHILTHGSPAFNEKSLFSWLRKL